MKYIYNPVTGTLDDVETPNLGEKYFASAETDALKDMMNEQFGPGTIKYGSEIDTPPKTIERDMFDNAFRDNAANGGMMRQNFKVGSPPSMAISYGIKKALLPALETMGVTLSAARLAEIATENPTVFNNIAAYVSAIPGRLEDADEDIKNKLKEYISDLGLNTPGIISPDATEMEREAEKIREMTKPVGFPAEPPIKIDTTTGDSEPPKIDTKESFPAETQQLPNVEGFPAETQQLPIIFESKKADSEKQINVKDLKKDFENKSWKDTVKITGSPAQGTRESIPQKTNIPFFEKLNTYSKQKHAGNLKAAIREIAGLEKTDKKTNLKKKTGDKVFESLYTSILNAANRSGFKFETTQNRLESNIELSKVPLNFVDFTDRLRDSPAIINNRLKEIKVNKNKVYNRQELQEILGIDTTVSKRSNNFFGQVLKDQGLTPIEMAGGKKGFRLNEKISALKDYAKSIQNPKELPKSLPSQLYNSLILYAKGF